GSRSVGIAALCILPLLGGCASAPPPPLPDTGPQTKHEKELAAIRVIANPDQVKGCQSLGVTKESFWGWRPIRHPRGRPMTLDDWRRLDAVMLGGNVALAITPAPWSAAVEDWKQRCAADPTAVGCQPQPQEERVIGEVYRCK